MELTKEEMLKIDGGVNWYVIGGVGALITYIIGIISGQIKLKWQNLKNTVFIRNLREKHLIQIRRKD